MIAERWSGLFLDLQGEILRELGMGMGVGVDIRSGRRGRYWERSGRYWV